MPYRPNFDQLIDRFGEVVAWHCLAEIEKASGIRHPSAMADC